ncbi:ribonuclease T2-like [Tulasnella sp. JGI-2019a]|nr:ribonuclease T2-like [Tulasnella sp. JGI-2019a]
MISAILAITSGLLANVHAFPLSADVSSSSMLFPRAASGCSASLPVSCHNTTAQSNLCCFEAPGGLITMVQFWDTNPSEGPTNSWTIHGLWPDHCEPKQGHPSDGTYSENCDSSRNYPSITNVLQANGRQDLITYMNTFWISNSESPEAFWEHEWDTHGTCYTTLNPSCPGVGTATTGADATAFFSRVVSLFQQLPTYTWLANAGITPGTSTHTLAQITSALQAGFGYTPAMDCTSGAISQVYYYFNLQGSLVDGTLVPINAPKAGSCATTALKYLTKTAGNPAPTTTVGGGSTTTTTTAGPTGTGTAPPASATINVMISGGSTTGCLLSYGTWSTQTCATFKTTTSGSGFTLTSSKGLCAVTSSGLSCASTVTSGTVFTAIDSGDNLLLAYSGSTSFSGSTVPSGTTQITLYSGASQSQQVTLVL